MKVKTITYPTPLENLADIYDDNIDIFVETEEGRSYTLTVSTPKNYYSYMEKEECDFIPAGCPDVIVKVLSDSVIRKALESYCEYDGYWLKLYYLAGMDRDIFSTTSMNQMLDQINKD